MEFHKIGIAADHAGKELKQEIFSQLESMDLKVVDYGVSVQEKKCVEYPFIYRMWKQPSSQKFVAKDKKLNSSLFGILRGTSSKASIFNPNTAGYIISNILK